MSVYLDDTLVTGGSVYDHLINLDKVLNTLATSGLKLNQSMCAFMLPKVEYLGHLTDKSGFQHKKRSEGSLFKNPKATNCDRIEIILENHCYSN